MTYVADVDSPYEDIDRKNLAHIKHYFLVINQERFARALSSLSERQQQFLTLLPLFFHVNHPMLPGYSGHQTPFGVQNYCPSKNEMRIATGIARSFTYQRDLQDKPCAIDALFIMGSSGTIADSDSSDIDVWVCHNNNLTTVSLSALQEKCSSLTRWAADIIHIEAFILNIMNVFK